MCDTFDIFARYVRVALNLRYWQNVCCNSNVVDAFFLFTDMPTELKIKLHQMQYTVSGKNKVCHKMSLVFYWSFYLSNNFKLNLHYANLLVFDFDIFVYMLSRTLCTMSLMIFPFCLIRCHHEPTNEYDISLAQSIIRRTSRSSANLILFFACENVNICVCVCEWVRERMTPRLLWDVANQIFLSCLH